METLPLVARWSQIMHHMFTLQAGQGFLSFQFCIILTQTIQMHFKKLCANQLKPDCNILNKTFNPLFVGTL